VFIFRVEFRYLGLREDGISPVCHLHRRKTASSIFMAHMK
jgi:hypothetical protein